MLRGLLREGAAAKALLESLGLFNDPERLEKYVVASEVTIEVLDLFFARLLGDPKAPVENIDLGAVCDHLGGLFARDQTGPANETLSERVDDHGSVMERIQGKVAVLERQLCAVQRQLKMQGDVSELAVAVSDRLDKIEARSEKQMAETGRELQDVKSQVANNVELLEKKIGSRASAGDVEALLREVSSLREAERRLDGQIVHMEEKIKEDNKALREAIELQFHNKGRAQAYTEVLYTGTPFSGIIAHIKAKCGSNPMLKGKVVVTCNTGPTHKSLENLFDYGSSDFVATENRKNSWYCIDMGKYKVGLTAYTLKSRRGDSNNDPIKWIVEGSDDNSTWKELDNRTSDVLRPSSAVHTFELKQTEEITPYKYIRFRQPEQNSGGNNFFNLANIELFGRLYEPKGE